mmetsp:Transcript_8878/g.32017  ORF Transcript_8878/g.32017 Transcript_8878/m.32017 type:complete len:304 (+) Transcript_8878:719-1630(+)
MLGDLGGGAEAHVQGDTKRATTLALLVVIAASDKPPKPRELQTKRPCSTGGAPPGLRADLAASLSLAQVEALDEVVPEEGVQLVDHDAVSDIHHVRHRPLERVPEIAQKEGPPEFRVGDPVQLLLHAARVVQVHVHRKVELKELCDEVPPRGGDQPARRPHNVAPRGEHLYDRRVGRWPADATFLQRLDQGAVRELGRGAGVMLTRHHPRGLAGVPLPEGLEGPHFLEGSPPCPRALRIRGQVALKDRRGERAPERDAIPRKLEGEGLGPGVRHLAAHRDAPDQVVEPPVPGFQLLLQLRGGE